MAKSNLTRALLLAALLAVPVLLSACNTVEGAGQDLKNAGAWIDKKVGGEKK